jgi:hypothetical protein
MKGEKIFSSRLSSFPLPVDSSRAPCLPVDSFAWGVSRRA